MLVMCINDKPYGGRKKVLNQFNVYTVIGDNVCNCNDVYILQEFFDPELAQVDIYCQECRQLLNNKGYGVFKKYRFIPIDDIATGEAFEKLEAQDKIKLKLKLKEKVNG